MLAASLMPAAVMGPTAVMGKNPQRPKSVEWDVAVIGAGSFGAWTAHSLRLAGGRVLLLDAYGPANSRASSGGESRIIRSAYGSREVYARWALESLEQWKALEHRAGYQLYQPTGVLTIVPGGSSFGNDTAACLNRLGARFERLSSKESMRRFPSFQLATSETAIFEPDSGTLMARRAIQSLVAELTTGGVEYRLASVIAPSGSGTLTSITTEGGERLSAKQFIFACGPWLPRVFPSLLGSKVRTQRAEVFFLGVPPGEDRYSPGRMPTWIDVGGVGGAYGMPNLEGRGCKVAVDSIDQAMDPDKGDRRVTAPYIAEMRKYVETRFPGLAQAPIVETRVCQYEMAANENYILDRHPDFNNVWIAGGGSGHGFKNGPAVGQYMAQLIAGKSRASALFSIPR